MSISFAPIGPWPVVAVAAVAVMVLTLWAYRERLRSTSGRWRWAALGLRLAAVLLCLIAALRPSIVRQEKKKQPASILFLIDRSMSMRLNDEANHQRRWDHAVQVLDQARAEIDRHGPDLIPSYFEFDGTLHDLKPGDAVGEPEGRETALGQALLDAVKRVSGHRVATIVLLADGANNTGIAPLVAARQLRGQQIPVLAVGFGSDHVGDESKDITVRDLVAGPTVFVKNQLQVKGTIVARGFANQSIDVALYVEGQTQPVAETTLKVPAAGSEVVPITGLKYIPQTPGEKKITIKVKPKEGELNRSNNEVSTFITVLKGGLNVLYLQGPNFTWEYKFLMRSIAASPDIQVDLEVVRRPALGDRGELTDDAFAPLKYDVYILGDMPASHLTARQHRLLTEAVEKGAGLIMLGGRSSFGEGGWANSELSRVLPVALHPGDGQLEPEGGLKFVPSPNALDSYVLQVGPNRAETARIWDMLPPLSGTNRFGSPKPAARVLAETGGRNPEPLMLAMETGKARVLAFGGETWVWARASDEGRNAHRKFWRQVIFWLAHKEDQGDNQIKLKLDQRRIAVGQKVELSVTARDAKGALMTDLQYETRVALEGPTPKVEPVELYPKGDEAQGAYYALGPPGDYKVTVTATRNGQVVGTDSARFIVYQDDREMENPAADKALLEQIAAETGGEKVAPERLVDDYLKKLNGKVFTEYVSQTEQRIWDNWPFFLIFTTLLTLEWWLRKRHGWV